MSDNDLTRHDHILMQLVFTLQAAAMQQMGKIQNPATGEVEVDLEQAKSTIDVLEMLKVKCRTDTPEDLLRMVDTTVMNLQLTYMDEVKKNPPTGGDAAEDDATAAAGDDAANASEAAGDTDNSNEKEKDDGDEASE